MPRHFDNPFERTLGKDYDPYATGQRVAREVALLAEIASGEVVVQEVVQQTTVDELYC